LEAIPDKQLVRPPNSKISRTKWTRCAAQAVKHRLCKCGSSSSNPSSTKTKQNNKNLEARLVSFCQAPLPKTSTRDPRRPPLVPQHGLSPPPTPIQAAPGPTGTQGALKLPLRQTSPADPHLTASPPEVWVPGQMEKGVTREDGWSLAWEQCPQGFTTPSGLRKRKWPARLPRCSAPRVLSRTAGGLGVSVPLATAPL
jgi:hypothetical protein